MQTSPPAMLQLPSFLQGSFRAVQRKTRDEGRRCAEQHQRDGFFQVPGGLVALPAGEVVVAHEVADLQHELPAWRLYMLGAVTDSMCEALEWKDARHVSDLYEAHCRESAWGALYFAISQEAPMSAGRMAARLQAVLRFWEPLQSASYVFKIVGAVLSLEQLMAAACPWVLDAWDPLGTASIRDRLEVAAERMARATREDSTEAILRELPRALAHARHLKHQELLVNPVFQRQRLGTLEAAAFERVSGAFTAYLLELIYDWDQQLVKQ